MFQQHMDGNVGQPSHILLDLGVSSFQIDSSNRGFTFQNNEPLDMRMDINASITAQQLLARYEEQLIHMFETGR